VRRLAYGLRLFLGLVLLATAAGKLADVRGFAGVLRTYEAFPEASLLPLAATIPVAELALSLWLFLGRCLEGAALAALTMHVLYAAWATLSLARGLRLENCGCFGVFLARPLGWGTVGEDLVLVGASAALLAVAASLRKTS
jgi:methylamine utilization protein MauE